MDTLNGMLAAILLALVMVELRWSKTRSLSTYSARDAAANFLIALGNALLKPLALAWTLMVLTLVEPHQLFTLEASAATLGLTFLVVELAYYWYHRLSHEIPLLWTMHHTHHSSRWFNFTTAIRLNWVAKFVSPLFFMPLVLLGFSPVWIAASLGVGLLYQLFLHTQSIPTLGWFEGKLLNTPSAHRVHHSRNAAYIDKNYGGALIVWDRLFGTYQAESEPVRYGVTTGSVGHNPFVIQLAPLVKYLRGNLQREKHAAAPAPDARSESALV
ncbi:MAG: sterol desaturase family protein [Pseudomonadota bacterium]